NPPELVESLEALGLTVFLLSNPTDLAGMYDNLELVGVLTDRQAEAVDLVGSLEERVAAALQAAAQAEERPTVFYEIDGSDPNAPWTTGPGTFIDSLITMAGGTNISA
ncbi:MAG: ABC transporter substrate-binding protein, partial [Planctomycetales bacterium]|nr:ABC transporter substrate-binding protein [Planctomycetales bacterium]